MPILLKEDLERPLPPMYWVRQQFNSEELTDVVGAVKEQLARPEVAGLVKPGAASPWPWAAGHPDLFPVVHTTIECLKALGAKPFIVSAMGSHGGGTLEGQLEILHTYGITQEAMGIPVIATTTWSCWAAPAGHPGLFRQALPGAGRPGHPHQPGENAHVVQGLRGERAVQEARGGPWRAGRGRPVPQPWAGRTSPPAGGGHQGDPRQDARAWRGGHRRKRL